MQKSKMINCSLYTFLYEQKSCSKSNNDLYVLYTSTYNNIGPNYLILLNSAFQKLLYTNYPSNPLLPPKKKTKQNKKLMNKTVKSATSRI